MASRSLGWTGLSLGDEPVWSRFAVLRAARDAAARDDAAVAIGPVVAAVRSVGVARRADADARRAAEFADGHHQRFLQHAAVVHVFQQGGEPAVELRAMEVLQGPEIGGVGVPRIDFGIAVGHGRPVHLHEARARLDQAAREQQSLAERGQAVALAHLVGLLGEVEGVARLAGEHQFERLGVVFVDRVALQRLLQIRHGIVDALQQLEAILQTLRRNFLAQREIFGAGWAWRDPDRGGRDRRPCRGSPPRRLCR